MRLAIDLDGVVANFNGGWVRFYNRDFDAELTADLVDAWDAIPKLTHFRHMGEFWRWARDLDGASLFRHLDTFPDAVPSMEKLASWGHDIVVVTSKPHWSISDTFAWIGEHRVPTTEVHIVEAKWNVEADVYLDDAPHQVYRIARYRPEAEVVRFARPWNHEVPGTHSVESWAEFVELVARLD